MAQSAIPSSEARQAIPHTTQPRRQRPAVGLRMRSLLFGILAAIVLTLLIAVGSRGFHWFDAALIGYAVATIFAVAAVTYKYSFWLARPPHWAILEAQLGIVFFLRQLSPLYDAHPRCHP